MTAPKPLKVFITAGEPSGDQLGAKMIAALRAQCGSGVELAGVGGPQMEQAGLASLFPMQDLSVMGLFEILPRLPTILRRIRETRDAAIQFQPDIVLTIDSPDFSFRVQKALRGRIGDARQVHYAAPTVWAWRAGRARKMARFLDLVLCLFPFEPPYFEDAGLKAAFVGHPAMEGDSRAAQGLAFRTRAGISPAATTLGLLFGSRRGELARMGPVLVQAARQVRAARPDTVLIAPTLPHLEPQVRALCADLGAVQITTETGAQKWDAFAACDAALATSGTVGLELAVIGVPHAIGYRMSALSWLIVRALVKTRFAHLANILLDRAVVPEYLQAACTPDAMAEAALMLLSPDQRAAESQRRAFDTVRFSLMPENGMAPSHAAARAILDLLP